MYINCMSETRKSRIAETIVKDLQQKLQGYKSFGKPKVAFFFGFSHTIDVLNFSEEKKLKTQIKLCNIITHIIMFLYYSYYYVYYQSYYYVLSLLLLEVAMQSFLYATKQSSNNIITIIVCPLPNQI